MDTIEDLKEIIIKLNEIDNYRESLSEQLSIVDEKQQDILHLIEKQKISAFGAYRLLKELKKVREERRKIKNDIETLHSFNDQKSRLLTKENRGILLQTLSNREKKLNTEYTNRQYKDGELEAIIK